MVLSIIVLIYNEGNLLRRCMESLLKQTVSNTGDYEIVLVDDGSTDNSPIICEEYAERYSFVKAFHKENGGCVHSRNYGIEHSEGRFFTFVDGDDFVDECYVENIYKAIQNDADYYILNNKRNYFTKTGYYAEKDFIKTGYVSKDLVDEWVFTGKTAAVWDRIYVRDVMITQTSQL